MPSINLLPWREREHQRRQTSMFWQMAAAGVCAGILVLGQWWYWQEKLREQEQRLAYLERERSMLHAGPEGLRVLASRWTRHLAEADRARKLRLNTASIYHVLVFFAAQGPDALHLRGLRATNLNFTAVGEAHQTTAFNHLLERLAQFDAVQDVRVDELGAMNQRPASLLSFRVQFEVDPTGLFPTAEEFRDAR
jgi:type IV pilus assembly protein PilN